MHENIAVIVWIVCFIYCLWFYHRVFRIIYLNVISGCLTEVIACGIISAILTALVLAAPYVVVPMMILLFLFARPKK